MKLHTYSLSVYLVCLLIGIGVVVAASSPQNNHRSSPEEQFIQSIKEGGLLHSLRYLKPLRINPNAIVDHETQTTVLMMTIGMHQDILASYLLEAGADANMIDATGQSALHQIAERHPHDTSVAIAKELIQHNGDWTLRDTYGNTPLHTATLFMNDELFYYFADLAHADINVLRTVFHTVNDDGMTLLHLAALSEPHADQDPELVSCFVRMLMIEYHLNANTRDGHGKTAVEYASESLAKVIQEVVHQQERLWNWEREMVGGGGNVPSRRQRLRNMLRCYRA